MDRELRVLEDGYELAVLKYNYEKPLSGKIKIRINRIFEISEESKSSYPVFEQEEYFSHGAFTTIEELKQYDLELLKRNPEFKPHLNNILEYRYDPIEYRYIVKERDIVGIAQVKMDFIANQKEISFLSARQQKEDFSFSSNSMAVNRLVLKDFFQVYLSCYPEFSAVDWN